MAKMEIALDLGTSYTSIFVSGNGIVLHEPSVIAYFDDGGKQHDGQSARKNQNGLPDIRRRH